jgi:hypothetical protein
MDICFPRVSKAGGMEWFSFVKSGEKWREILFPFRLFFMKNWLARNAPRRQAGRKIISPPKA